MPAGDGSVTVSERATDGPALVTGSSTPPSSPERPSARRRVLTIDTSALALSAVDVDARVIAEVGIARRRRHRRRVDDRRAGRRRVDRAADRDHLRGERGAVAHRHGAELARRHAGVDRARRAVERHPRREQVRRAACR